MHLCWFFFLITAVLGDDFDGPALYQVSEPVTHAECPTWDARNNILYYVDVWTGTIYSYNYTNKEMTSITLPAPISPVVPSKSDPNLLIVGQGRTVIAVQWNREDGTYTSKTLLSVAEDKPDSNFNDGKADKEGRIWFGTMDQDADAQNHPDRGSLYKITKELSAEAILSPVNVSNGLAWNKANNKFYYIDSTTQQIAEYDYDDESGEISNRRVAYDLKEQGLDTTPDGMTIDEDDNLWVALFGGGSVIKVNPTTGVLLERYPIPAESVSSVMWGGPDLDVLFITTSRISLAEDEIIHQPGAGSVFALTNLGTKGVPVFEADIVDSI